MNFGFKSPLYILFFRLKMRIPLILFSFVLIECSVGAPTSGCSSELEDYKELVNAKASIKSSLVTALLGKHL